MILMFLLPELEAFARSSACIPIQHQMWPSQDPMLQTLKREQKEANSTHDPTEAVETKIFCN